MNNLYKNFNHSILFSSSLTNVNHFKFSIVITITTNQKRQNNWKNSRILSKHQCEMKILYSILELSRNNSKITISTNLFSAQNIKNHNIETFTKANRILISTRTWNRKIAQNVISYECNMISNQKTIKNSYSMKLTENQLKSLHRRRFVVKIANATSNVVFENWFRKRTSNEKSDHFQTNSYNELSNKQ